ncbi:MAG: Slp family lipoprotein [Nitrosomonas sp.]|nr:Slp family lipoprotein [Nitrosomonas sp.]
MKFYILLISLLLSACSVLPPVFNDARIKEISYAQALEHAEVHTDTMVRWGGVIIGLENAEQQDMLQVLFHPLDSYGRPDVDKPSEGYFLVSSPEPLDQEQYIEGREIVVVGILAGKTEPLTKYGGAELPLIKATGIHLWAVVYRNNYYWHCPSCYFQQLYW